MEPPLISSNLEVRGGTPVFYGTRVPIQTFLDYLETGESIDDLLEGFPTVSREQVIAFLVGHEVKIAHQIVLNRFDSKI